MISETLVQKLHEQKSRIGLIGSSLDVKERDGLEHNVQAYINPNGWNITIKVKKGFEPIHDRRQKAYARKKGIEDGLEILLTDVLDHECGHWELPHGSGKGCPFDIYNHDLIIEAVKKGLPEDKRQHAGYVANLFEDIVDNAQCNAFRGDFSGQVLFWDHEGIACKRELKRDSYTPIYEAFVKLNMHLWGDNADRALVKRHYSNEKNVDDVVAKIVKDLKLKERMEDVSPLFEKKRWARMAQTLAGHLAPLLDVSPHERPSAYSPLEEGSEGESQGQTPGNGIEQKVNSEEGKEEIAYGRYKAGNGPSPSFEIHEQLHALYTRLARDIAVKVESMSRPDQLAIAPLTHRRFDEEQDDPTKMRLNKMYPDERGIGFGYEQSPLIITAREKMQRRSFPDFNLQLIDNSGSMREAIDGSGNVGNTGLIPWGDRSKYHFALLGFYGVQSFLRKQGIAPFIRHGAVLFSSGTRHREADFGHMQDVYRHILSPDWGGTTLNAEELTKVLRGRESFTLSISDGAIDRWESERATFKQALQGQHYAHIQLGGENQFSHDLAGWGVPVYHITNASQLPKLMIDTAKSTYGRFTKR